MNLEKHQQIGARCASLSRLYAMMLATLVLGGCASAEPTRINVEDGKVFLPSLRAGFNLNEDKQVASEPQTGHAIEFNIATANGGDVQSIDASQPPLSLNNTTFAGAQQIRNEFNLNFASASWRWRKFFKERALGLEVFAGAGRLSLGLDVSSPTQSASDHFVTWGPQGGAGLIWRISPGNSLQGRVTAFFSSNDNRAANFFRSEVYYAKSISENLALRAGFASWEVSGQQGSMNNSGSINNSDFNLMFSGPLLALDINLNN